MRAAAAALLLLAGCSGQPDPEPTPSAVAMPVPDSVKRPVPAIDDRPQPRPKPGGVAAAVLPAPELEGAVAPGGWTLKASASGAAAQFGGAEPRFAIRCDPASRTIAFTLKGTGARLRIVTANGSASFDARPEPEQGGVLAEAPAQYTFVTQTLARAQDGFAVVADGGETLRLPWDRAVEQVIRSCQPD